MFTDYSSRPSGNKNLPRSKFKGEKQVNCSSKIQLAINEIKAMPLQEGHVKFSNQRNFRQASAASEFNQIILGWSIDEIYQPMLDQQKLPLQGSYSSRAAYYGSFENLIFEEVRAILHTGLLKAEQKVCFDFTLVLTHLKSCKKGDTREIKFKSLPGSSSDELRAGEAVLLQSLNYPKLVLIGLANYSNDGFIFKIMPTNEIRANFLTAFEKDEPWRAEPIGSTITLRRMYEGCKAYVLRQTSLIERCMVLGRALNLDLIENKINAEIEPGLPALNDSQKNVIEKFPKLKEGLCLVQGPPGTGKTTAIVQLLRALQTRNKKVLVCAPSNKAIHTLAERFIHHFPEVPVILVGVTKKLSPDNPLTEISLDLWDTRRCAFIDQQSAYLNSISVRHLSQLGKCSAIVRAGRVYENLNHMIKNFNAYASKIAKYELSWAHHLNQSFEKLHDTFTAYSQLLEDQSDLTWKEASRHYAKAKEAIYPDWVKQAEAHFNLIASTLILLKEGSAGDLHSLKGSQLERELLQHSKIVFATLSVSGQRRFEHLNAVDSLIVDEAGQALEAELSIPMKVLPLKCMLIGDIQQLPATVISQDAEKLKFGRSMMERLIKDGSQPYSMFDTQYRMHPEISLFPSKTYYQGLLKNAPSVSQHTFSLLVPYAFVNVAGREAIGPGGQSFFNTEEVKSTAALVNYLANQGINVQERVAVISFYAEQVARLSKALTSKYPHIKVKTVDGFQGGEMDIVIISCVRANLQKQVGFLNHIQRLNVALTRARLSLIILGNVPTLKKSNLNHLVVDAKRRNVLLDQTAINALTAQTNQSKAPRQPKPKRKFKPQSK